MFSFPRYCELLKLTAVLSNLSYLPNNLAVEIKIDFPQLKVGNEKKEKYGLLKYIL